MCSSCYPQQVVSVMGCFTGKYPSPPTETMDIVVYDKPLSQSKTNKKL